MSLFIKATENYLPSGIETSIHLINSEHIRIIKKRSDDDIQVWLGNHENPMWRITKEEYEKLLVSL